MDSHFQVPAVSLIDDRRHFRLREVVLDRDLDDIDVVEGILAHCLPRFIRAVDLQKFLLHDCLGNHGVETLDIRTPRCKFASGGNDSRALDAAGVDRVSQRNITINTGVPEVTCSRETTLQVFARQLRAQQYTFTGRLNNRQQQTRNKLAIESTRDLGLWRRNDVEKKVGMTVN